MWVWDSSEKRVVSEGWKYVEVLNGCVGCRSVERMTMVFQVRAPEKRKFSARNGIECRQVGLRSSPDATVLGDTLRFGEMS